MESAKILLQIQNGFIETENYQLTVSPGQVRFAALIGLLAKISSFVCLGHLIPMYCSHLKRDSIALEKALWTFSKKVELSPLDSVCMICCLGED